MVKKWLVGFAVSLGCTGIAYGQNAQQVQALEDVGMVFVAPSYVIAMKDLCENEGRNLACADIEFEITRISDGATQYLTGRTLNQRRPTPSLLGYTASQGDTTYSVITKDEQTLVIIKAGEALLEEKGRFVTGKDLKYRIGKSGQVDVFEKEEERSMTTKLITAQDAQAMLNQGALLIDIRSPDEYNDEHIAQAKNKPTETLEREKITLTQGQNIIFYCNSGNSTNVHAQVLASSVAGDSGTVYLLQGGIGAWKKANFPTITDAQ